MSRTTSKKFDFLPDSFDIFWNFGPLKKICFRTVLPKCPNAILFWNIIGTKKMRDVRTINSTAIWGRELCYVSENEGFRFLKKKYFLTFFVQVPQCHFFCGGGDDDDKSEITWPLPHRTQGPNTSWGTPSLWWSFNIRDRVNGNGQQKTSKSKTNRCMHRI